jgi:hypothetical protein
MNFGFSMLGVFLVFEVFLQIAEDLEARALKFADPALVNLMERDGIEVMQFLATMPDSGDEVGLFKDHEVLGDGLAGHVEVFAEIAESAAIVPVEDIEQLSPTGVGERFEHRVVHGRRICNQKVACQGAFSGPQLDFEPANCYHRFDVFSA